MRGTAGWRREGPSGFGYHGVRGRSLGPQLALQSPSLTSRAAEGDTGRYTQEWKEALRQHNRQSPCLSSLLAITYTDSQLGSRLRGESGTWGFSPDASLA